MSVPVVVIEFAVESRTIAYAVCGNADDEQRLLFELRDRDVLDEVRLALALLYDELAARERGAA